MQVQRVAVAAAVRMAAAVAALMSVVEAAARISVVEVARISVAAAARISAAAEPISAVALRISAAAHVQCRILPRMAHLVSPPAALAVARISPRTLLISTERNFMPPAMA